MNVIILGDRSDIVSAMRPMMEREGWNLQGWNRDGIKDTPIRRWDLIVCAMGQVAPVGLWHEIDADAWESAIHSNVLIPVRLIRSMWHLREPNAAVCFFAGANPNAPMPNYSAYSVGKMALLKACEHLDLESPDCKFFALAPGTILTKIHNATLASGTHNPVLERVLEDGQNVPQKVQRVFDCLKWCLAQPKEVIGGRNVCSSDPWDQPDVGLAEYLNDERNAYKLRRWE